MANAPFYEVGRYVCEALEQSIGESSKGNPQFALHFRVLGKPTAQVGQYEPIPHQYERTYYKSITDKTISYFVEDLKALGYTRSSFRYLDPNVPGFHNFAGQSLEMFSTTLKIWKVSCASSGA
jgi:hypothetical protein